ncbi:hypothetical protein HNY73_017437 [Argiope bruennichi]|uniref:Uncharacterized protein n=1 Tax=Argiope bruennichi TaxID=94029 RepID=A0A8T0EAZ3_ARGBR|nr:hypothetical protein HNY73_017437 [Argiope bruennichi]
MGLCMSRCYTEVSRLSCWRLNAGIEDRDRLIDFDMFLDEQAAPRPLSISSWLSCVRSQLGVDNEELELQEEIVATEFFKEADKIKQIAENSTELINPAKLALDTTARWERFHTNSKESQGQEKGETSNEKPLKEQASCSSPSSSVELEWENEDGLSPVTHIPGRDDPSSDTASCLSELSTPVSNGNEELEWDGHFTSTHISQLDMETERLISEIERLTSGALQGAESSNR